MIRKILVAVDDSEASKQVFSQALSLAKMTQASLMLLHVLSPDEESYPIMPKLSYYPGGYDDVQQVYLKEWEVYEKRSMELLRSLATEATNAHINHEFTQLQGSAGRRICELANTWEADLIVVGRRGRSGLGEFFLGSVSTYVTHNARCSVLVVQGQTNSSELQAQQQVASVN
jgi:nucleotide-binding universal stress UspA family protein